MHQTKRVAVSSAQTFLQPSAPIKSVRHPAIAARPHQPQHAPADPDTTHLLDPNSGPTAAPADDTRHRFRSRPVPAAPARTGSGHPPRARRRKGTTAPIVPAVPANRLNRPLLPAPSRFFPSSHPNRTNPETRRPETSPDPRLPAAGGRRTTIHVRHPPGLRKRSTTPVDTAASPLGSPRGNPAQVPATVRPKSPRQSARMTLRRPPGPRASIFFFAAAIPSAQGPKPLSEHFPHPERSAFTAVLLLFMDYFFIFASIGK